MLAAKCEKTIRTYDAALGDDHAKAAKKSKLKHAKVDAIERVLVAQAAYAEAVRALRAQQLEFEGEMKALLREFEILERARLHHLSLTLKVVAQVSSLFIIIYYFHRYITYFLSCESSSRLTPRLPLTCYLRNGCEGVRTRADRGSQCPPRYPPTVPRCDLGAGACQRRRVQTIKDDVLCVLFCSIFIKWWHAKHFLSRANVSL